MAGEIELETTVEVEKQAMKDPESNVPTKKGFTNFFAVSQLFGYFKRNIPTPTHPMEIKVDIFLRDNNYYVVQKMVENGYQLNKEQKEKVQHFLQDKLLEDSISLEGITHVEDWLKLGIPLAESTKEIFFNKKIVSSKNFDDYRLSFFLETNENIGIRDRKNYNNVKVCPLLTQTLRSYITEKDKNGEIYRNIFTCLYNGMIKREYSSLPGCNGIPIVKIEEIIKGPNSSRFFNHIPLDDYLNLFQFAGNKELSQSLEKGLKEHYEDKVNDMVKETKKEYGSGYISQVTTHKISEVTNSITMDQLPKAAKGLIEEINTIYQKVSRSGQTLPEDVFDINNLFEKRIPEILTKYLTIDSVYRTTMTNREGKNAEELMIDSLENIKSNFENAWQSINEQQLSSLSVTNKYTKNFKK